MRLQVLVVVKTSNGCVSKKEIMSFRKGLQSDKECMGGSCVRSCVMCQDVVMVPKTLFTRLPGHIQGHIQDCDVARSKIVTWGDMARPSSQS